MHHSLKAQILIYLLCKELLLTCGVLLLSLKKAMPLFFCLSWATGELTALRELMKVPNKPGLSPNNNQETVFLSDQSMASNPRKGRAKRFGAKTTSHDGKAGHVMTHVCHCARQEQRRTIAGLDFTLALG